MPERRLPATEVTAPATGGSRMTCRDPGMETSVSRAGETRHAHVTDSDDGQADHIRTDDIRTDDIHGRPGVALVYLFFVFLPLFFMPRWSWLAVGASLVAIALFVPLHYASYRRDAWGRALYPFAAAVIGYALIPINPGGNTFVIYAMVMAAVMFPVRRVVLLSVLFLLLMGLEFWWVMPELRLAIGSTAVAAVIGAMVVAGTLFDRNRARRDAELRLTQDEVRRLAALAERERIGRDLHDLLGHTLSVIALKSELAGKLITRDADAARQQIGDVEQVARQALAQVREAVTGIRASGLQAELAAARLTLLSAEIALDQRLGGVTLDPASENTFALILREAVTNVLRHAGARRVDVELDADAEELRLSIADDGRGGIGQHGNGLTGMRERAAELGGRLEIDSLPGAGTRLVVHVPRRDEDPDPASTSTGATT